MMLRFIALMLTTYESCGLVEGPFEDESLVGVIASASGEQRIGVVLVFGSKYRFGDLCHPHSVDRGLS